MQLYLIEECTALGDYGRILRHGILTGGPFGNGKPVLSGCHPFEAIILPSGRLCVSESFKILLENTWPNIGSEFVQCAFGRIVGYDWNGMSESRRIAPPQSGEPIDYLTELPPVKPSEVYYLVKCETEVPLETPSIESLLDDPSGVLSQPRKFRLPIPGGLPPIFAGVYLGRPNTFFVTGEFLSKVSQDELGDAVRLIEYSTISGRPIGKKS